jgi:outer membrane protein TolC
VLIQEGGYLDGLRSIADFDTPSWNVSLSASYPIGTSSAETSLERARLQLRQTDLALRSQELAIVTQVTSAGLAVQNTFLQLEAARRSREAAEQSAEAELARFDLGVATLFEVVTAQNAVTSARLSELQATINHLNAIADFDRIQRIGG